MNVVFKKIIILTALLTIAPAHTKQIGKPTQPTRPAPVQPMPSQPAPVQPVIVQPQPASTHNTWTSSAGLVYKSEPKLSNRINHVLEHGIPPTVSNKLIHTTFSVAYDKILDLVDEAWRKRGNPQANPKGKGDIYIIDMGRVIGTQSEKRIQINTFQGTSEVISAYPVK